MLAGLGKGLEPSAVARNREKIPLKLIFNNPRSSNKPGSAPDPRYLSYTFENLVFFSQSIVRSLLCRVWFLFAPVDGVHSHSHSFSYSRKDQLCFIFQFLRQQPKLYSIIMENLRSWTIKKCSTRSFCFKSIYRHFPSVIILTIAL